MTKSKKLILILSLVLVFVIILLIVVKVNAKAAEKIPKGWDEMTVTRSDLNGDGKTDKITVLGKDANDDKDGYDSLWDNSSNNVELQIKVNDAVIELSLEDNPDYKVYRRNWKVTTQDLYKADKLKELFVSGIGPNGEGPTEIFAFRYNTDGTLEYLFRYYNESVVTLADFNNNSKKNTITLTEPCYILALNDAYINFEATYKIQDGQLVRTKNYYQISKYNNRTKTTTKYSVCTAAQDIPVFKNTKWKKQVDSIEEGENFYLYRISNDLQKAYVKTDDGYKGWVDLTIYEAPRNLMDYWCYWTEHSGMVVVPEESRNSFITDPLIY